MWEIDLGFSPIGDRCVAMTGKARISMAILQTGHDQNEVVCLQKGKMLDRIDPVKHLRVKSDMEPEEQNERRSYIKLSRITF